MRQLLPLPPSQDGSAHDPDETVAAVYAADGPLLRLNMIGTLDGSGVGPDGLSGSINTDADHRVFEYLRGWADAVIVSARTAEAEGYTPLQPNRWSGLREHRSAAPLLAVVSRHSELPPLLADAEPHQVLALRGEDMTPATVVRRLHELGHTRLLLEGGPSLAHLFVAAGLVDELCLSFAPRLVGGDGTRILRGDWLSATAEPASLLEEDGTLLTRWTL